MRYLLRSDLTLWTYHSSKLPLILAARPTSISASLASSVVIVIKTYSPSSGVPTRHQTSLTLGPLADPSLPSLPPLDPTPKLATPLTSLLPTASTAPIGYADIDQQVSECRNHSCEHASNRPAGPQSQLKSYSVY